MSDYEDRPYPVGKGKPPAEYRWKKGQSGNPKGAPRKTNKRRKMLREIAVEVGNQEMTMTIGGKEVKISKKDALLLAVLHDGFESTPAHRLKVFKAMKEIGAYDILPEDRELDPDALAKFVAELAEGYRLEQASNQPE